jgi:putative oxidoreductase
LTDPFFGLFRCYNDNRDEEDMAMRAVKWSDAGLLLIRVGLGVVFVFHGSQKLFGLFGGGGLEGTAGFMAKLGLPAPMAQAVLAGSAEFFGGLALLTGFGARLAVVPLVVTMLVASFWVHGEAFDVQKGGMEYPLTLAFVLAGLGLTGPGALALAPAFRKTSPAPDDETVTPTIGVSQ